MSAQDEVQPIIVKKIKKGGHGHHGGAWKVAYADFVTAMMAFFLLLWLLNVTTEEQKAGIADYFDPNPRISDAKDGAGGMLGGLTVSPEGAMVSNVQPVVQPDSPHNPALRPGSEKEIVKEKTQKTQEEQQKEQKRAEEQERFDEAKEALEKAMEDNPDLKAFADNLIVDVTPEGLRIQVVDQDGSSMFASGSAQMYDKTKKLMQQVAKIITDLPNELSIRGHTDGTPYGPGASYTNWELSSDRANASRRVLLETGIPETRLSNVVGKADTEHLFPDNPFDARNRRISIILLKEELTNPNFGQSSGGTKTKGPGAFEIPDDPLYEKSDGEIDFP